MFKNSNVPNRLMKVASLRLDNVRRQW